MPKANQLDLVDSLGVVSGAICASTEIFIAHENEKFGSPDAQRLDDLERAKTLFFEAMHQLRKAVDPTL